MFTNPLAITSQFSFCSLPLRLDAYRGCAFGCTYCFALQRGGNTPSPRIAPARANLLESFFSRAVRENVSPSPLTQMLLREMPIHFGGMSDPFQPAERRWGITKTWLTVLAERGYPTVISTKSDMVVQPDYLALLKSMDKVVVQFSFSSVRDAVSRQVEPNSPSPSRLLTVMSTLARNNVLVTCRWQPYIRGLSETPQHFVAAVTAAGARHIALEHLKVPTEQSIQLRGQDSSVLSRIRNEYLRLGAKRDGREFVLRADDKVQLAREVRELCHERGVTFGAADNELQYLSDSEACCSGVDQFRGFGRVFRYNIALAVRRGINSTISYDAIAHEWRPTGSVDRFLNSHSRLGSRLGLEGSIEDHIRYRWETPLAPGNPADFFGVRRTEKFAENGLRVYDWDNPRSRSVGSNSVAM